MRFSKKFISATEKYTDFFRHIPAPLFRKTFEINGETDSAIITITGLGFYKLFINGKDITKGMLAPYISNTDHIIYYDEYNIAPLLKKGKNAIGIILGNGMQNCPGGRIWDFDLAPWRSAPKLALSCEVKYMNGEAFSFEADESFKISESPIWFDDLRCGVFYNALKEQDGWSTPDFDDSGWGNARFSEAPRGEARLCKAEPIRASRRIAPVSINKGGIKRYTPERKEKWNTLEMPETLNGFVYDFGVNSAGVFEFKIKGAEPGRRIEFFTSEVLDDDGDVDPFTFYNFYPEFYAQRDIYICKGGEESFIPDFTYHGYRYCLVTGLKEEEATADALTYIEAHSALKEKGGFICSDETINKLQSATRISDLANFYYFPTDCPHREKNGWTGDASVSSEHMLINLSPEESYREWLNNIRCAMKADGRLPGIIPTAEWGYQWGNGPMWDSVLTFLPFYTYKYRGDKTILEENADAILRYINYISNRRDENGLIAIGLGDWLHPNRGSGDPKCPIIVTDSIISMVICRMASFIFGEIGRKAQSDFAKALENEFRDAIRNNLVDFNKMSILSDTQTALSMAIYFKVFEKSEIPFAVKRLVEVIHQSNDLLDGGFLSGRYMFHVLSNYGYADLAYKMIVGPAFPSYGYWLKNDATSLWEDFYPESRNSMNHHFWGDISAWFIKAIAGIKLNPENNNVKRVDICPNFITDLSFAEGWHNAPEGKIFVRWDKCGDEATIKITIPETMSGRLYLPDGWITQECEYPFDGVNYMKLKSNMEIKLIKKEAFRKANEGVTPVDISRKFK